MKIEKISENAVRLVLSKFDFEKRNLNSENLKVGSPGYQKFLMDIVEHAEIELGARIDTGKIIIEPFDDGNDNFQITVECIKNELPDQDNDEIRADRLINDMLKIGLASENSRPSHNTGVGTVDFEEEAGDRNDLSVSEIERIRRHMAGRANAMYGEGSACVCFKNYNDMYAFFRQNRRFAVLASTLYMAGEGFYVMVRASKKNSGLLEKIDNIVSEFQGMLLPPGIFRPFLEEYGEVIYKSGAIKKIIASLGDRTESEK